MSNNYHAYLVRIWRPDTTVPWRILVESIPARERKGIRNWEELVRVLRGDVSDVRGMTNQETGRQGDV